MVMKWCLFYGLACAYYERYGDLDVPLDFKTLNGVKYNKQGHSLGKWVLNLRTARVKGKLKDRQIMLLDKIGMNWEIVDKWESHYQLAFKYYKKYGNLEIPYNFRSDDGVTYSEDGFYLGPWVYRNYYAYKNHDDKRLDDEKRKKLEQIGFKNLVLGTEDSWMEKYYLAKNYYEHYGNLKINHEFRTFNGIDYDEDGIALGLWIMNLRMAYKGKGSYLLTEERIRLLDEIGMIWFIHPNEDMDKQDETIRKINKIQKQKEILHRTYSLLNKFKRDSLPSRQELNDKYMETLDVYKTLSK